MADFCLRLWPAIEPIAGLILAVCGIIISMLFVWAGLECLCQAAEPVPTAAQLHRKPPETLVWIPVNRWEYVLGTLAEVKPGQFYSLFDSRFDGPLLTESLWDAACEPETDEDREPIPTPEDNWPKDVDLGAGDA